MRKIKVKIFYPVQKEATKVIELDVPDGVDLEDWLYDNELRIIEGEIGDLDNIDSLIQFGLAGIRPYKRS